jgi:hypothetical protein
MNYPSFPDDFELAKLNLLEARKTLDEYELTHGYGGSPEHQKLESEFSNATETFLRRLAEGRTMNDSIQPAIRQD